MVDYCDWAVIMIIVTVITIIVTGLLMLGVLFWAAVKCIIELLKDRKNGNRKQENRH